jgi:choloylglycine hydrolase
MSDGKDAIVIEPMEDGLKIFDNPVGVLTNNPPFDKQLFYLNNYRNLSNKNPENTFGGDIELDEYSRGMGGIGLPGDLSSASRFAKVAFTRANSYSGSDEASSVGQFFHILESVEQQNGCTFIADPDLYEYTIYTSCYNTDKGILYYRTYNNSQITAVDLNKEDLDSNELINYLLINEEQINFIN